MDRDIYDMYLGSPPKRRRRSSPWRVLTLLVLIAISLYVLVQIRRDPDDPVVLVAPTVTPTRSAAACISEGEELYWAGDLRGAIAAYEEAVRIDGTAVEPTVALARLLALEGRTLEAVQYAQGAVELVPESDAAWMVLGMAHHWRRDIPRAVEACQRAVSLAPENADAHSYLAGAYVDAQQWALAVESVERALELDSGSVDVQRNHGYVMEVLGDYRAALQSYQRAAQIHPRLATIHISIGNNQLALGEFDAAVESFERAVELDPNNPRAYHRLGRTLYERGHLDRAEGYFEQAIAVDPEFGPAFGYLGFTNWNRRNYEDAIPHFERGLTLDLMAGRRRARRFLITVEDRSAEMPGRWSSVLMSGDFTPLSSLEPDILRASLTPLVVGEEWAEARGAVSLNTRTGVYEVRLEGLPQTDSGRAYVGWFDGVRTLSGGPLNTGPLTLTDGRIDSESEASWVQGPRIDTLYTLGLAYFYMAECEKAYPLFDAALEIDPQDRNALEGIRMCDQAGG